MYKKLIAFLSENQKFRQKKGLI